MPFQNSDPKFSCSELANRALVNLYGCQTLGYKAPCMCSWAAGKYLRREMEQANLAVSSPEERYDRHREVYDLANAIYPQAERNRQLVKRPPGQDYISLKLADKFAKIFDSLLSQLSPIPADISSMINACGLSLKPGLARANTIVDAIRNELSPSPTHTGPKWGELLGLFPLVAAASVGPMNGGYPFFLAEPEVDTAGELTENLPQLPQVLGLNDAFWSPIIDVPAMVLLRVKGDVLVRKPCVLDPGYDYQWYYVSSGQTKPVDAIPVGMSPVDANARRGRQEFMSGPLSPQSVRYINVFATADWEQSP